MRCCSRAAIRRCSFTRPLSLVMLLMAAALMLLIVLPNIRKTREVAFQEDV